MAKRILVVDDDENILSLERTILEHAPRRYQLEALSARIDALSRDAKR